MWNEKLKTYKEILLSVCKTLIDKRSIQIWSDLLDYDFISAFRQKLYVKEKCAKEIFAIESQNTNTLQYAIRKT